MPMTVRLSDKEQELLRQKAVEINKNLISKGMQPLTDSKLVHAILEQAIPSAYFFDGKIKIDSK